jgi:hemoglobin
MAAEISPPISSSPCVASQASVFARIGGAEAIARLVDEFYQLMDALAQARDLRAIHPADLASTRAVLKLYLGEWLGGPALYSEARGHPRLRRRHIGFRIGPAERDAWMVCMTGAVNGVVDDAALRDELLTAFFKLADWVRNDQDNPHDQHR